VTFLVAMADSCDWRNLHSHKNPTSYSLAMVAGYIDGPCRWSPEGWSAFPNLRKVRISVEANPLADVFDIEKGTASIDAVLRAIRLRASASLSSVIYSSYSNLPPLQAATKDLPVAWWVAWWVTPPTREAYLANDWAGRQFLNAQWFDYSVVDMDRWPKTCRR
jgi:hypothetical protein